MRKTPVLVLMGLLVVSLVAVGVFAMPFDKANDEAKNALEAGDFTAWKEAMISQLTEERFNRAVEGHQKMIERKTEMMEQRSLVQDAIESEDYQAWLSAIGDNPRQEKLIEVITEENFATFVEMHQARQSDDFETAQKLSEKLGLERNEGFSKRMHFGKGMRSGMKNCGK
ncbi:MAG: hypothetical protein KKD75_05485 [Nanoarchaeota archaeon]|nr:hypothetical protein [Nanoarchaeota archaeon]MBU1632439.1 hypothetical protein [Nanoarchaeota archaeon]